MDVLSRLPSYDSRHGMLFIRPTNPVSHRLARIAFLLACAGALTVGLSGPLHRYLGIEADMAIGVFRYGFYIAAAAIALGLATIVPTRPGDRRRGFVASVLALAIGVGAAWAPINWLLRAREAPRINDITTDTAHPPPLVVTLQFRQNAPNPPAYGGESVANLQKAGYPDIQPIVLKVPPAEAFKKVDQVAMAMGWDVVARAPAEGRLEAIDTTRWFGFHDDIVVRIKAEGSGSRIDIRSKSRVGNSDLGVNAQRIREFTQRLKAEP
jgi:uncharacterized protein (DUF1499 family)